MEWNSVVLFFISMEWNGILLFCFISMEWASTQDGIYWSHERRAYASLAENIRPQPLLSFREHPSTGFYLFENIDLLQRTSFHSCFYLISHILTYYYFADTLTHPPKPWEELVHLPGQGLGRESSDGTGESVLLKRRSRWEEVGRRAEPDPPSRWREITSWTGWATAAPPSCSDEPWGRPSFQDIERATKVGQKDLLNLILNLRPGGEQSWGNIERVREHWPGLESCDQPQPQPI